MTVVLAVLLLGALGSKIPSDADIAANITAALQAQLQPAAVQVQVKRRSQLSSTIEQLDITLAGFNATALPLAIAAPADPQPGADPSEAAPADGKQVRIKVLHVTCTDFLLKSLPINAMEWELHEVYLPLESVKQGRFALTSVDKATGYFRIKQQALTQLLRQRELTLKTPVVTVSPEGCQVAGSVRLLFAVPVAITGKVVPHGGAKLYLDDPKMRVSVVTLPEFMSDRLLRDINPLTDLNTDMQLPVPLTITRVSHEDGALRFDARLQFPSRSREHVSPNTSGVN